MLLGSQGRKQLAALGEVSLVGIEMAVSILIGHYGGRWLDEKLGTTWLQWVGFALGVVAGFRSLYRVAQRERRRLAQDAPPPNDSAKPK